MKIIKVIVYIILIIFISCNNEERYKSVYTNNLNLEHYEISSFGVTEVLKPIDMTIGEKYLCILHEEKNSGEQIFVFDANDLKFKYKFSKRGSGPQETFALDMAKNMKSDTLYLIDQAKRKILSYKLNEQNPIFLEERGINLPVEKGPVQETYIVNDSVLIGNFLDGDLIIYDISNERIIDKLNLMAFIKGADTTDGKFISNFSYSYEDGDIYLILRLFDKVYKINLDSELKLKYQNIVPLNNQILKSSDKYNLINYHAFIQASGPYVLTQYYGRNLKSMQPFPININGQNLKYDFIIFERDMTPILWIPLDVNILRGFIDGKRKRIYYFEANEDFESLKYIKF